MLSQLRASSHRKINTTVLAVVSAEQTQWTALHRAAERGRADIVKTLLAAGADHTLATSFGGDTALHLAADRGHTTTVQLLVDSGADAKLRNKAAFTPLHTALHGGRQQVARDLLKAGADPADLEQSGGGVALSRSLSYYSPRTDYSYSPRASPGAGRTYSGTAALASPNRSISGAYTAATLAASPRKTTSGDLSPPAVPIAVAGSARSAAVLQTMSSYHQVTGDMLDEKYRNDLLSPMRADQERRRREEQHRIRMGERERRRR